MPDIYSGSRSTSRNELKKKKLLKFSFLLVGTAMLGVFTLLSLGSLVALVRPPNVHAVRCRRCCDHLEPAEGSGDQPPTRGFNHVPEVRTYINMTILKGTFSIGVRRVYLYK